MFDFDNKLNNNSFSKAAFICQNEEFLSVYINSIKDSNILFVTNTLFEANKIYDSIINYNKDVLFFPADDFFFEESFAASPELAITRIETINKILDGKNNIIITNLMGILRFLPTKSKWKSSILKLSVGDTIRKENFVEKLYSIGYVQESLVKKTGDFANRGFIVDVFPCLNDNPIRIEFWGDSIESIRFFDIDSQRSYENLNNITIFPTSEFISSKKVEERKQKFLNRYEEVNSIASYLDDCVLIYKDKNQINNSYIKLIEDIKEYNVERNIISDQYFNDLYEIKGSKEINIMTLDNIFEEKYDLVVDLQIKNVINYKGDFELLNADLKAYLRQNKTIIIGWRR